MSDIVAESVIIDAARAAKLHAALVSWGKVILWAIYRNPADFPDKFVARPWDLMAPFPECLVADSLAALIALLPPGLTWLPRQSADDPAILGVYL